jgi:hypothetical protein
MFTGDVDEARGWILQVPAFTDQPSAKVGAAGTSCLHLARGGKKNRKTGTIRFF